MLLSRKTCTSSCTTIKTEINKGGLYTRMKYIDELLSPCSKSNFEIGVWSLFYLLIINSLCNLWSVPPTSVVELPGYWWEPLILGVYFVNALYETVHMILECKLVLGFAFFVLNMASFTTAYHYVSCNSSSSFLNFFPLELISRCQLSHTISWTSPLYFMECCTLYRNMVSISKRVEERAWKKYLNGTIGISMDNGYRTSLGAVIQYMGFNKDNSQNC